MRRVKLRAVRCDDDTLQDVEAVEIAPETVKVVVAARILPYTTFADIPAPAPALPERVLAASYLASAQPVSSFAAGLRKMSDTRERLFGLSECPAESVQGRPPHFASEGPSLRRR